MLLHTIKLANIHAAELVRSSPTCSSVSPCVLAGGILLGRITAMTRKELRERLDQLDSQYPNSFDMPPEIRREYNHLSVKLISQVWTARKRNTYRRAQNAILREACGTSARAAREDMGI